MTWTDADSVESSLALCPVGSTEQHGPHAPLGTDRLTAEAIASAGAQRADQEVVVTPTIPIGVAEEHRQFTGTLWVREETFRNYVRETITSLASHGWNRVIVVNGHGGNVSALRELCGRITRDEIAYAVPFTWFDSVDIEATAERAAIDPESIAMGHGGAVETSLLQHLHPDLVETGRFEEADDGAADRWGDWQSSVNLAFDTAEFSENGVVGTPSDSTPELGKQLFESAVDSLVELLETVEQRDVSRLSHR